MINRCAWCEGAEEDVMMYVETVVRPGAVFEGCDFIRAYYDAVHVHVGCVAAVASRVADIIRGGAEVACRDG